ncbi:MAG: hypothetical protein LBH04_06830 [Tannerellaceae bacterium]|nr:hypothetical protein [Tannerellaceae bacterium]
MRPFCLCERSVSLKACRAIFGESTVMFRVSRETFGASRETLGASNMTFKT